VAQPAEAIGFTWSTLALDDEQVRIGANLGECGVPAGMRSTEPSFTMATSSFPAVRL
jgi:hypothetical protein